MRKHKKAFIFFAVLTYTISSTVKQGLSATKMNSYKKNNRI